MEYLGLWCVLALLLSAATVVVCIASFGGVVDEQAAMLGVAAIILCVAWICFGVFSQRIGMPRVQIWTMAVICAAALLWVSYRKIAQAMGA